MSLNPFDDAIDDLPSPPQAAAAANPYDAIVEEMDAAAETRMRVSLIQGQTSTPDRVVASQRLARETGLPYSIVDRNFDAINKRHMLESAARVGRDAPQLRDWIAADSANAALAHDDMHPLSTIERTLGIGRNLAGALGEGLMNFSSGIWGAVRTGAEALDSPAPVGPLNRMVGQVPTAAPPAGMLESGNINLFNQPKVQNPDGSVSTVDSLSVNLDGKEVLLPTVTPDGRHFAGTDDQRVEQAIAEFQKTGRHLGKFDTPEAATAFAAKLHEDYAAGTFDQAPIPTRLAGFAAVTAAVARSLADRARGPQTGAGWTEQQVYGGVASIGQMVPSLVLGAAFGPAAALGAIGVSTGGQSYTEARDQGVDADTALLFAGIQGAVEVGTEYIPAHRLLGDLAVKAPFIKTLMHQVASEIPGEEVATVLQDLNEWAFLPSNKDRTFADYLKERPSQAAATAISTITAIGGTTMVAHGTARVLEQLGDAARESTTVSRAPDQVRALVNQITQDGPLATVHLPVETFTNYFQSHAIDPGLMAERLTGDRTAYARAVETGADLAVPMGAYLTEIAASPHHAYFAEEARLSPDALNTREARALDADITAQLEAIPAEEGSASAGLVRDAVLAKLTEIAIPPDQAAVYATVYEHIFQTFGARAGLDPVALFERRGHLQITREGFGLNTPASAIAEPSSTDAPAAAVLSSEARSGETAPQREQRTRSHWAQLLATVLRDARAIDPTVDPEVIRAEFASRRERFDEGETLTRESGTNPENLLRAVAAYGGLKVEADGTHRGEIDRMKRAQTGPDQHGGVKGVFREKGLTPDGMVEALRQDQRFAHIESINDLLDALDDAVHQRADVATLPGVDDLPQALGIQLGTAWWSGGAPPLADVADQATSFFQDPSYARQAQLEERIRVARARGGEDLRAVRELQALRDESGPAPMPPPTATVERHDFDVFRQEDEPGGGATSTPAGKSVKGMFTPGANIIKLFASADLSTLWHESAHFYLEIFADVAEQLAAADASTLTDLQRGVLADFQVLLDAFEYQGDAASWRAQSPEARRAAHEQFARGFEAYLLAGKAPSAALRSVFARARAWLVSIYRSVRGLNVTLTPEVRGVMDRLLATDDAIAAVEQDQHVAPLFTDAIADAAGLSAAERADYHKTVQAASDHARETLQAKLLAQLQRERAAWWRDERNTLRAPIARQLAAQPVYRALALLQRGTQPNGAKLPAGVEAFKLSQDALVEQFGESVLARLPRPRVYTKSEGVPPNVAAELLGFPSGSALVHALATAPTLVHAIDAAADAEMTRRHGDLLLDGTIVEHARQAVIEAGAEVFAAELKGLAAAATRQPGGRRITVPPVATLRAIAERRIADTAIKDIRPAAFAAAARRAGEQALEAAGRQDFTAALAAKQRQVLNAELYRAATAARETVDDAIVGFKPIFGRDAALAQRYNLDLVNAARSLLSQFQLAPPAQGAAAHVYLEQVRKYDPEMHIDLEAAIEAAAQPARPYREMTLDQFTALRDAIGNLWHTARRSRQMVVEGKARDLADVRAELEARLQVVGPSRGRPGYTRAVSQWDKTKLYLMGWRAALRRVESWVDAVDSGDPGGAFRRLLFTPISEGASQYRDAKKTYLERYLTIVKAVESSLTTKDIAAPEIGYTFSGKMELLHALLHTGNDSNRSKLLRGRNWGIDGPDGQLDASRWDAFVRRAWQQGILTATDYTYVQGVWDLLEDLKPQAQQVHHDLYGYFFAEITAQPIQTPFGEYRGGYMPAIVDPFIATDAAMRGDKEALEQTPNSFMFPTTGRGFTKGRIEPYARPLALDLRTVPAHLDKVLRFVHLEPRVKDAARLVVSNKGFRRSLDAFDPTVAGELLVPWLQRAARQTLDIPAQGWGGRGADRFWRALRRRTGAQIMVANVVNALQQVTGLSVSALKVPIPALHRALWSYVRAPHVFADGVAEKSAFMRTTVMTSTIEVQQHIDDLLLNPSTYEQARAFASKHGYFLSTATQNVVNLITWGGAYDHAIAGGGTEPEAVRQADAAVRLTQGTFNPEDLSAFETGSPMKRAFTMFYSYFNMLANTLGSEFAVTIRDVGLRAGAGRLLYVYAFGFVIPAVLSEVLTKAASGRPWDEDEDGLVIDDLLALFFGAQLRTATAMLPGIGPAINAGINSFNNKWYDDRISVSPAVSAIEGAVHAPAAMYHAVTEGRVRRRDVKDTLTLIGLLSGLPVAAAARPLGYLADVDQGTAKPTGPVDVARGLVVGR